MFHPLLMATYLMALFAWYFPSALYPVKAESHGSFVLFVAFLTFVLPCINLFFFRQLGVIRSLIMQQRKERIMPFLFIALLYIATTALLYYKSRIGITDNVFRLFLVIDVLVVTALVITVFYKASIHSLAACGMLGILLPMNKAVEDGSLLYPLLGVMLLTGLVLSARLQLQAHTPRQVLVGATAGFAASFITMVLLF